MKKELLFMVVAMLLMTGMTACSSDDDVVVQKQQNEALADPANEGETRLPDAANFIREVTETGHVRFYGDEGLWVLDASLPVPEGEVLIDGGIRYFMYNLPEAFRQEGLKVKFTGDVYQCMEIDKNGDGICTMLGGYEYYDVVVKEIEVVE